MLGSFKSDSGSWVTKLIFINVIVFLLQIIFSKYQLSYMMTLNGTMVPAQNSVVTYYFGLTPAIILSKGYLWQFFSYMFLHSTYSYMHLLFNMYALLLFGSPIEQLWGSKKFLQYYFFTGIGAGLVIFGVNLLLGGYAPFIPTIGASGAVFGLLLAFGLLFPNAELLIFFFLPMKAKYLVILYGFIEFYMLISSGGNGGVSHVGHLGGIFFGVIFFLIMRKNLIKFKAKEFKARAGKDHKTRENTVKTNKIGKKEKLFDILIRVKENGIDSISDDEYQFVRELDIMSEETNLVEHELVISKDDKSVIEHKYFMEYALKELRKYL